jgi:hypothetical protein
MTGLYGEACFRQATVVAAGVGVMDLMDVIHKSRHICFIFMFLDYKIRFPKLLQRNNISSGSHQVCHV